MGARHTNEYNLLVPVILNYDDIQVDRENVYMPRYGIFRDAMFTLS